MFVTLTDMEPNNINYVPVPNLPLVAIVILNWNGKAFLEKFLPSVLLSTYKNVQLIVADNASTDDSISFLQTNYPTVTIIINPTNQGFAKGYNTALSQVKADYFVLLNSDVLVTESWIEPIINLMEANKNIAACQPKIMDYNNQQKFEYAGACGGWIDSLGYPFARGRILENLEYDIEQYNHAEPCFWASGAAMFVQAKIFTQMGGFDEYFFAHQEEIDLCWRMQLAGYSIYVQPQSVVYHVGGGTLPKGNSKKTYLNFRNNLIMCYKNTAAKKLVYKIPIRIGLDIMAAYKGLFSGDGGYFVAIAKAHLHVVKWLFTEQVKPIRKANYDAKLVGVYKGSMLWQFYMKKCSKFSQIIKSK